MHSSAKPDQRRLMVQAKSGSSSRLPVDGHNPTGLEGPAVEWVEGEMV